MPPPSLTMTKSLTYMVFQRFAKAPSAISPSVIGCREAPDSTIPVPPIPPPAVFLRMALSAPPTATLTVGLSLTLPTAALVELPVVVPVLVDVLVVVPVTLQVPDPVSVPVAVAVVVAVTVEDTPADVLDAVNVSVP